MMRRSKDKVRQLYKLMVEDTREEDPDDSPKLTAIQQKRPEEPEADSHQASLRTAKRPPLSHAEGLGPIPHHHSDPSLSHAC